MIGQSRLPTLEKMSREIVLSEIRDLEKVRNSGIIRRGIEYYQSQNQLDESAHPQLIAVLPGHDAPVLDLDLSHDGRYLASVGEDLAIRIWDLEEAGEIYCIRNIPSKVFQVRFLPNNNYVISGGWDKHIRIWKLKNAKQKFSNCCHSRPIIDLSISSDGTTALSLGADSSLCFFDLEKIKLIAKIHERGQGITALKYSPVDKQYVTGNRVGQLQIWNEGDSNPILNINTHGGWIRKIEWSPDGQLIIAACSEGNLYVWDAKTGEIQKVLLRGESWIRSLEYLWNEGILVSGGEDNRIVGWSIKSGDEVWSLEIGKTWVNALAYSADLHILASGSSDNRISLWKFS